MSKLTRGVVWKTKDHEVSEAGEEISSTQSYNFITAGETSAEW